MRGSARAIVLSLALIGFGVFAGAWCAIWLSRGSYLTALIIGALTIWSFGFAVYFLVTTVGAAKPRTQSGAEGTLLRPGVLADTALIASAFAIFSAAALYLIFAPLKMVDYVPSGVMRVVVPVSCVFLVLFGVPTLYRMFKHRGGGHLRLDPLGFEVWNGQWGSFRRGTWEEVEQVLDRPLKGSKPFNEVLVFALPKGRSAMLVSDAITGDSRALREWVRLYWQHPECRAELVDDRGLRRLDEAKFSTE